MNNLAFIIEDDPKLAAIFAEALRAAEYETEIISDGRKALTHLDGSTTANLIVLDLHLPHVSGREILRAIRANERYNQSRVILATADPLLAEELRPDADLVLLKPISFIQLRDLASRLRPRG
jgi:two-component system cell cycle response regulator DivK